MAGKTEEISKGQENPKEKRRGQRRWREAHSKPHLDVARVEAVIKPFVGSLLDCAGLEEVRMELDPKLSALRLVVRAKEEQESSRGERGRRAPGTPRTQAGRSPGFLVQVSERVAAVETLLAAQLERQGLDAKAVWISLEAAEAELQESDLQKAVESLARLVLSSGRACALGPMSSGERRLIHEAASNIQGVWTRSAGEGAMRRLWLLPSRKEQH